MYWSKIVAVKEIHSISKDDVPGTIEYCIRVSVYM